jgi:hypothetical protein
VSWSKDRAWHKITIELEDIPSGNPLSSGRNRIGDDIPSIVIYGEVSGVPDASIGTLFEGIETYGLVEDGISATLPIDVDKIVEVYSNEPIEESVAEEDDIYVEGPAEEYVTDEEIILEDENSIPDDDPYSTLDSGPDLSAWVDPIFKEKSELEEEYGELDKQGKGSARDGYEGIDQYTMGGFDPTFGISNEDGFLGSDICMEVSYLAGSMFDLGEGMTVDEFRTGFNIPEQYNDEEDAIDSDGYDLGWYFDYDDIQYNVTLKLSEAGMVLPDDIVVIDTPVGSD